MRCTSVCHRWNRNPRPQPQTFSKVVLLTYVIEHDYLSKLVFWGSSWGRGFRFHWLVWHGKAWYVVEWHGVIYCHCVTTTHCYVTSSSMIWPDATLRKCVCVCVMLWYHAGWQHKCHVAEALRYLLSILAHENAGMDEFTALVQDVVRIFRCDTTARDAFLYNTPEFALRECRCGCESTPAMALSATYIDMYVYIFICVSLSLSLYIYIYTHTHTYTRIYTHWHMLQRMQCNRSRMADPRTGSLGVSLYIYIYIYRIIIIYIYIYIYIIQIHIHIYTYNVIVHDIYIYIYIYMCIYIYIYIYGARSYGRLSKVKSGKIRQFEWPFSIWGKGKWGKRGNDHFNI